MQLPKPDFTRHQVNECDLILADTTLLQFPDAHNDAAAGGQHGVQYENPLFILDIVRELAVEHNGAFVFRLFISLDKNLADRDPGEEIHDLPDHRVARADDSYSTVILGLVLKLVVVVGGASR